MARKIEVAIIGNAESLERAFGQASKSTEAFGNSTGKVHKAFHTAVTASTAVMAGLGGALFESVKAAELDQQSKARMATQLKALNVDYAAHANAIDKTITAESQLAGFTKQQLTESFTALARVTKGNVNAALRDTALAADIARGKGIELAAAQGIVTKASLGMVGSLRRQGIDIPKVTAAYDALKASTGKHTAEQIAAAKATDLAATKEAALAALRTTFAGAAEAQGKTAIGAQERLKVTFDNLKIAIGSGLLPILEALAVKLQEGAKWMEAHTGVVKIAIGVIGGLAVSVLAIQAAMSVAAAATAVWSAAQWVLNAALTANPIGIAVVAIAALTAGVILAYKHSATFRELVTGAFDAVKIAAQAVADFVTVKIPAAFDAVLGWLRGNWPIIATIISGPFAPIVALATNAFGVRSALEDAFNAVKGAASRALDGVVGFFRTLPGRILGALGDLGTLLYNAGVSIIQGLLDGLTSKLKDVENLVSSIAGKIASLKGPISADLTLLIPHGQAIITGLQTGMEAQLGGLLSSVSGFAPTLQASLAMPGFSGTSGAAGAPVRVGGGGGSPIILHSHLHVDGRELFKTVQKYAARDVLQGGGGTPGSMKPAYR